MFVGEPSDSRAIGAPRDPEAGAAVAVVGILVVGIVPSPLLDAAQDAAAVFAP